MAKVGQRATQNRVYSLNNLRELGQFAVLAVRPDQLDPVGPGKDIESKRLKEMIALAAIPAGTIRNDAWKPDERLSWLPLALPYVNQRRQDTSAILTGLDRAAKWDAAANLPHAKTTILALIPTAIDFKPDPAQPAPTYYVGLGGVGSDAATLPTTNPKAGCFRYDQPTPFNAITDGLAQSILFAETAADLGPWLRGGPSTVRTVDPAKPLVAGTGQFGGVHVGFACVAFADGSATVFTDKTDRNVFLSLVTIAGGKADPLPGE
jgi:hypothetical protein